MSLIRRRFPLFGALLSAAVAFVCLSAASGCGGAKETPVETARATPKPEVAAPAVEAKPAEPAPKAADPSVTYALPNVEFTDPEVREKMTLGGKELRAEVCQLDTSAPVMKHEWFGQAIRSMAMAPDGALYVLDHEYKARRYLVQPGEWCKLALDRHFGKDGVLAFPGNEEMESIAVLDDGTLVGIRFGATHHYKDGKFETKSCGGLKGVFVDGKTGFSSFGGEIETVDLESCSTTKWNYTGWDPRDKLGVDFLRSFGPDRLMAAAIGGVHYVAIHGADGKQKVKFGKDRDDKSKKEGEQICYAQDADLCGAGLCVVDSNCRRLSAWDPKKGTFVGSVEIGDLLEVFYPWPMDLVMGKSGTFLSASHKEKQPEDAREDAREDAKELHVGMIFRIEGLN